MKGPSKAPELGERIGDGRFELLAKLGEGGMSVVYRAYDHLLQVEVALKLLQPRYVGRPEREQRLINEARYLRRLQDQPHIVELLDAGRLREFGWPWLATEVLVGNTLNWQFVTGNLSPEAVLSIASQVAESLLLCHQHGIVNRDPTPSNVFVINEDPYQIKLFDFSHAAELGGPALEAGMPGRLTGVFEVPGTVGYMGPEQARKAVPDASMDVFGFGALLYELATKQRPYAQFSSRELFLDAQRNEQLEPLRVQAWTYGLPEEFGTLVFECTQRAAGARPTMAAIVERLATLAVAEQAGPAPAGAARVHKGLLVVGLFGIASIVAWKVMAASAESVGGEPGDWDPEGAPVLLEVVDTSGAAEPGPIEPAVAEVVQPRVEPIRGPEQDRPRKPPRTEPKPADSRECEGVEAAARAAEKQRNWAAVLEQTKRSKCWSSKRERKRLEVSAYVNLGQWDNCIEAGRGSHDAKVQTLVSACKDAL